MHCYTTVATIISFHSDDSLSLHLKSSNTDLYCQGWSFLIAPSVHSIRAVRAIKKIHGSSSLHFGWPLLHMPVWPLPHQSLWNLVFFSNTYTFQQSCTPPTAFELGQLQQQLWLTYLHCSFRLFWKVPVLLANVAAGTQSVWNPRQGRCTHSA